MANDAAKYGMENAVRMLLLERKMTGEKSK